MCTLLSHQIYVTREFILTPSFTLAFFKCKVLLMPAENEIAYTYLARYCLTELEGVWLSDTLLPLERSLSLEEEGEERDSLFILRPPSSTTNFCPLMLTNWRLFPLLPSWRAVIHLPHPLAAGDWRVFLLITTLRETHCRFPCLVFSSCPESRLQGTGPVYLAPLLPGVGGKLPAALLATHCLFPCLVFNSCPPDSLLNGVLRPILVLVELLPPQWSDALQTLFFDLPSEWECLCMKDQGTYFEILWGVCKLVRLVRNRFSLQRKG